MVFENDAFWRTQIVRKKRNDVPAKSAQTEAAEWGLDLSLLPLDTHTSLLPTSAKFAPGARDASCDPAYQYDAPLRCCEKHELITTPGCEDGRRVLYMSRESVLADGSTFVTIKTHSWLQLIPYRPRICCKLCALPIPALLSHL